MKVTEIFTPGAYPTHTYVERSEDQLEVQVRDALATPGQVVAISGPSKSGKTVLVEKIVGRDLLIPIPGASLRHPDDVWEMVLNWMDVPNETADSSSRDHTFGAEGAGKVTGSLVGLASAEGELKGSYEYGRGKGREERRVRYGLPQVVKEIGESDFVVLIDDFHYMPREVQVETAKNLKEAVRQGVRICTATVPHRGDDVVRANPELRGRVRSIDLRYWPESDLRRIADLGFDKLNVNFDGSAINRFTKEAAGSPQLMQLVCLNAGFVLDIREQKSTRGDIRLKPDEYMKIYQQTSASTDFRSLVDVLDSGPRMRGTERNNFSFRDGSQGDVYRCILKSLAADPPKLSFDYDELTRRTAIICGDESPPGSSMVRGCTQMSKLAIEKFPAERVIEWDEQKQIIDIPDPYLLFYLRWSGRLDELN